MGSNEIKNSKMKEKRSVFENIKKRRRTSGMLLSVGRGMETGADKLRTDSVLLAMILKNKDNTVWLFFSICLVGCSVPMIGCCSL